MVYVVYLDIRGTKIELRFEEIENVAEEHEWGL